MATSARKSKKSPTKRSPAVARETAAASPDAGVDPHLAQVRDLLFGAHVREMTARIEQLEQSFEARIVGVRDEILAQLEAVEARLTNAAQGARDALEEDHERKFANLEKATNSLEISLGKQTQALAAKMEQMDHDLRQHTLTQTKNLWEDLRTRYEGLSSHVDEELTRLRDRTADRSTLGDMFRQLADRLVDEHSGS